MVTTAISNQGVISAPIPAPSTCGEWLLYEYDTVTSTNLIAANLHVWTAVRANTQTNGRGRFQRAWVSDAGGLWLSAVVPLRQEITIRRALPLAAGLAICKGLGELGISGLRLRWPNDVMLNDRKLAGLLIDQFVTGKAVVGIGLNVRNHPEKCDAALTNQTTRLADFMPNPPVLGALTRLVLDHLQKVLIELDEAGAPKLFRHVNALWGIPRTVELDLNGTVCRGIFEGIDSQGRLALADERDQLTYFDAHEVRHLAEMEPVL